METKETETIHAQEEVGKPEVVEVVVTKKGQTTIPVKLRKKHKIEEGTRLVVIDTKEGILLKPKKSIWDKIGIYSKSGTPEEVKEEIDQIRHEDDDE